MAERARAVVECRYTNKECGEKVYKTIQNLVASPQTEGTTCTVNIIGARPSMTTSDAILGLFDLVQEAGKEMGCPLRASSAVVARMQILSLSLVFRL